MKGYHREWASYEWFICPAEDSALYPGGNGKPPKNFKEENHVIQIYILRKVSPAGAGIAGCGRYGETTWGRELGQEIPGVALTPYARGLGADSGGDCGEQAADQKESWTTSDSSDLHSHVDISFFSFNQEHNPRSLKTVMRLSPSDSFTAA